MHILGIDPGSRLAGFACLKVPDTGTLRLSDYKVIDAGVLKPALELNFAQKLYQLSSSVDQLIQNLNVDVLVIEKAFTYLNPSSALKIGEVRGAILAQAASHDLKISEFTPKRVKKIVTGNGNATKQEVADAVTTLLQVKLDKAPFDVTDAMAIALTYMLENNSFVIKPAKGLSERESLAD